MSNEQLSNILIYSLIGILILFVVLIVVYIVLTIKDGVANKEKNQPKDEVEPNRENNNKNKNTGYGKQSIFNFMEFDKIEDNMIVQKKGERYLMVVECQGVNYDLMSEVEKNGVEEGYVQFLNILRHPIQIYIQTRTINLEDSINTYKEKVREVEDKLLRLKANYEEMKNSSSYTDEQKNRALFEYTKQRNLYEYGNDIIYNTEKMNLNKNISTKKYYIVIPYYTAELGSNEFDKDEIKNIAFSELYNRSQSIIRTLSVCGVNGKILNSIELAELLFMAYNRDEAEVFAIQKAISAGCDEIYSTAPDVLDKKMQALDKEIESRAIDKAQELINEVKTEKMLNVENKEKSMDELIDQMVELILEENKDYIGEDVAAEAVEKLLEEGKKKKGGRANGKKETTSSRNSEQ